MRIFCILAGLILSAAGLLALLAHPHLVYPNVTWVAGMCVFYWGAFALKPKRIFARRPVRSRSPWGE